MEIEFNGFGNSVSSKGLQIASLTLTVLVILGALGWWILPNRVLTWTEWQVIRQRAAYTHELRTLTDAADLLIPLLEGSPDPVRGSLVAERVRVGLDDVTLYSLSTSRQALLNAADAVEAWSLGAAEREDVVSALMDAQDELAKAIELIDGH